MLEFTQRIRTPKLDIAYADAGPADGSPGILLHGLARGGTRGASGRRATHRRRPSSSCPRCGVAEAPDFCATTLCATAPASRSRSHSSRAQFVLPGFSQARNFWYQWFMSLDGGPDAMRADPKGFARIHCSIWNSCRQA
jgi:hypothetical protein